MNKWSFKSTPLYAFLMIMLGVPLFIIAFILGWAFEIFILTPISLIKWIIRIPLWLFGAWWCYSCGKRSFIADDKHYLIGHARYRDEYADCKECCKECCKKHEKDLERVRKEKNNWKFWRVSQYV